VATEGVSTVSVNASDQLFKSGQRRPRGKESCARRER
jgi:hypothetical protein